MGDGVSFALFALFALLALFVLFVIPLLTFFRYSLQFTHISFHSLLLPSWPRAMRGSFCPLLTLYFASISLVYVFGG